MLISVGIFESFDDVSSSNHYTVLQALYDGKKVIITESTVRRDLHLEDAEGVDCLPNATIFEQLTLMGAKTTAWNEFSSTMASKQDPGKLKRKDTEVPQPSGSTDNVADEAVYEEMDDNLERAGTTTTSLDVEQDRGNINKTQSKATLNEPSSLGTSSSSGPGHQETMGDTIAQTGFENVSKLSNDPLLAGVNTPRSGEDIKKLEKKGGSRTHKLKRLYKIGRSVKVIYSNEASLGDQEDASKQGRIADIDADAGINTLHRSCVIQWQLVLVDNFTGTLAFCFGALVVLSSTFGVSPEAVLITTLVEIVGFSEVMEFADDGVFGLDEEEELEVERSTYREAVTSSEGPQWKEAIKSEIDSILQKSYLGARGFNSWLKPLGYRWIFKKKLKANGTCF
ncbi:hypothetical protein Tco_0461410 [Tanacetum coccineum]